MFTLSQPSTGYCTPVAQPSWGTLGHIGARALALEAVPTSAGKHANYWHIVDCESSVKQPRNQMAHYRALFAPSTQARFIQSPDIVLVPISHHFLCNYRLPLHHIAFENFPH